MHKIKITCDSTCDLTAELYEKYDVEVLPLGVSLGDEFYHDGVDVTAKSIFEFVEKNSVLPKTAAVSVGEYEDVFRKYVDQGYSVIHINISSELSACHQNARLAAEEVGNVYPIDSRNLSTGSGLLVIAAAELVSEGYSVEEIVEQLNEMSARVDASFVLQTLEYLKKGGRCSSLVALGANVLQLRPEIEVVDGGMKVGKKYRGKMERSIADYVKGRLEGREDIQLDRIFVTHSYVPKEIVESVVALVKELHPFAEVLETTAGCTISSHCGPNCLGVLFFRK
ncbi:MAG: DegV family protein [Lachnospiraceae bacterium]|nr:DegV family protein [Lachnospiraceae bacterium]